MKSVQKQIAHIVENKKRGHLIFPALFKGLGTDAAIKMALTRLVKAGKIVRVAHGIYTKPKQDPLLGKLLPSLDDVAEAVAKKERVKIKPSALHAVNKLGLSEQVPTRTIYITDGPKKEIKVGKSRIIFKPTTAKKLALKGEFSSLVIQALEVLDPHAIDQQRREKILYFLKLEEPKILKHDLKLAPAKVNNFIYKLLKDSANDKNDGNGRGPEAGKYTAS